MSSSVDPRTAPLNGITARCQQVVTVGWLRCDGQMMLNQALVLDLLDVNTAGVHQGSPGRCRCRSGSDLTRRMRDPGSGAEIRDNEIAVVKQLVELIEIGLKLVNRFMEPIVDQRVDAYITPLRQQLTT